MLFLQVASFFVICYLDSVILTNGPIAYFMDELMGSWTSWLGCLLAGSTIFIENTVMGAFTLMEKTSTTNRIENYLIE